VAQALAQCRLVFALSYLCVICGQTPWSAADALVGLFRLEGLICLAKSGSGGTRADQGVRPTTTPEFAIHVSSRCFGVTLGNGTASGSSVTSRFQAPMTEDR
jgi:hypothetical protein